MPKKKPIFKVVKFGEIKIWEKNPRKIDPRKLKLLAHSIVKYGLFQNLTCWMEGKQYVTGGGNMRYRALKEELRYGENRNITISVNFPETEAEKIELSFLDNQAFGFYNELEVANMVAPVKNEIELAMLGVTVGPSVKLSAIIADHDPDALPLPLVKQYDTEDPPSSRVVIMGDLGLVGIGAFCCIVHRVHTDGTIWLLTKKFGENREQRREAGVWFTKLLADRLKGDKKKQEKEGKDAEGKPLDIQGGSIDEVRAKEKVKKEATNDKKA